MMYTRTHNRSNEDCSSIIFPSYSIILEGPRARQNNPNNPVRVYRVGPLILLKLQGYRRFCRLSFILLLTRLRWPWKRRRTKEVASADEQWCPIKRLSAQWLDTSFSRGSSSRTNPVCLCPLCSYEIAIYLFHSAPSTPSSSNTF